MQHIDPEQIRQGDEKAFEALFAAYFQKLCRFATEYVLDKEIARELVQDSFARLWETKDKLQPESNIPALLYAITRNNSLNYLKRIVSHKRYFEYQLNKSNELQLNLIALSDFAIENFIADELQEQIEKAIQELPEKCRSVFEASRNEGLSYMEIAREFNISERTVENHIAAALKKLRERLKVYL